MASKFIVSNGAALLGKYQAVGVTAITTAIGAMITADKTRGIDTKLIFLDDAAQMQSYGAPVTKPGDPQQHKNAVDALAAKETPDYLMILGAPDVVPFQDLTNPAHDPSPPRGFFTPPARG